MIPDEYKFLESGESFLQFDSGEYDGDRILVFGIEPGLDDLVKHEDWACDRIFKCSPDVHCLFLLWQNCLMANSLCRKTAYGKDS